MTGRAVRGFEVGSTAVRRDVFRGKVASAAPCRVVRDFEGLLALARWPGVEGLWQTTWIEWLRTGDESARAREIRDLAAGRWELGTWTWRETTKLDLLLPDAYFGVSLLFRDDRLSRWYVDFQRPCRRTPIGVDNFDLLLDLVIEPDDMSYRWKDQDEYAQGRRLGVVTDGDHHRVERARDQVVALLEQRTGPFDDRWRTWRRDPGWALPTLPPDTLTVPADTPTEPTAPTGLD